LEAIGWRLEAKIGNNTLKPLAKRSSNLMPPKAIGWRLEAKIRNNILKPRAKRSSNLTPPKGTGAPVKSFFEGLATPAFNGVNMGQRA